MTPIKRWQIATPDDIAWEFRDVEAGASAQWDLDIDASFPYVIQGVWLETDNGTLTNVSVTINEDAATGLSGITVDTEKDYTPATGNVVEHDRIRLNVPGTYTGTPTLIRGKLIIFRS